MAHHYGWEPGVFNCFAGLTGIPGVMNLRSVASTFRRRGPVEFGNHGQERTVCELTTALHTHVTRQWGPPGHVFKMAAEHARAFGARSLLQRAIVDRRGSAAQAAGIGFVSRGQLPLSLEPRDPARQLGTKIGRRPCRARRAARSAGPGLNRRGSLHRVAALRPGLGPRPSGRPSAPTTTSGLQADTLPHRPAMFWPRNFPGGSTYDEGVHAMTWTRTVPPGHPASG